MTGDGRPGGARTFRAPSGPVALALGVGLALFLLGDAVVRAGWAETMLLAPWVLLVLWIVYVSAFVSSIRVDGDGARVQNLLRRTAFGWKHVRAVGLRWQLTFSLDDGRQLECFGGPAKAGPLRIPGRDGEERVPLALRALDEIEERRQAAPETADAPILRSWDLPALWALVVIALWAAASVLIVNS